MKSALCVLLVSSFSVMAFAQPTITVSGPPTSPSGKTIDLLVTLSNSAGSGLNGVQWTFVLPAGFSFVGTPTVPATLAANGFGIYCGTSSHICMVVGWNGTAGTMNTLSDGLIATVPVIAAAGSSAGASSVSLTAIFGGSLSSTGVVAVTVVSGSPLNFNLISRCDLNWDGVVDAKDVALAISGDDGRAACPVAYLGLSCAGQSGFDVALTIISAVQTGVCLL